MGEELKVFYNEDVGGEASPFLGRGISGGNKYSEKTRETFDRECLDLVNSAYIEARSILEESKKGVGVGSLEDQVLWLIEPSGLRKPQGA
jgi:ATP-dependent Zn protease